MKLGETVAQTAKHAEALWEKLRGERATTFVALMRPQLGATPPPLRRVLEPVVAASALLALGVLISWGALSVGAFLIAGLLIALILERVFGIEVDLEPPLPVD